MSRKKYPVTNIGTSLILVVFIVLALVTFATLSVVNANRDYQAGEKVIERTTAYYTASNKAEVMLGEIDDILLASYDTATDKYFRDAQGALEQLDNVEIDFSSEIPLVSYAIPIEGSRELRVELALISPQKSSDSYYQIKTWQDTSTKQWNSNTKLNLLP